MIIEQEILRSCLNYTFTFIQTRQEQKWARSRPFGRQQKYREGFSDFLNGVGG